LAHDADFPAVSIDDLPGGLVIEDGLRDAAAGKRTPAALLVTIAAPRLRRLGLPIPSDSELARDPELLLYECLRKGSVPDPYSQYNALLRELVSFEHALERRVFSAMRRARG
jgi:hypothetical protein